MIPGEFQCPALFFMNGFGDQLISLPAMRALATIFPGGMQLLLGEGNLSFFYRGLPVSEPARMWWKDFQARVIDVEKSARDTRPCDLFVCLSPWGSPSVVDLARRLEARCTVGHFGGFDQVIPLDKTAHVFDLM